MSEAVLVLIAMGPAIFLFAVFNCAMGLLYIFFKIRQKTRNPQRRRMYVGQGARPSLTQQEPTIYVSPSNLPPPPKYEALAPPSYDEVVGVHYPNYQPTQVQPITAPITTALAQGSSNSTPPQYNEISIQAPAVITVTSEERRPSVQVARS